MSLYQNKLKEEIEFYQNSILRYKENIRFLKQEAEENNVISYQAHIGLIREYSIIISSLKARLKRAKRLIH